jgi:uncharacterized protein YyaL (SSP411 family)
MGQRLLSQTSPYLLQHAGNPVDWFPWGPEAFEVAQREDKPIFLSIGYASCHWCHVMAHEVFEDEEVGQLLNEGFVSIKVDREERPDVDEAYMTALQLASGRGGWPLSAWLTPDGKPFFLGTYLPKEDRDRHPGFVTLSRSVLTAWRTRREELLKTAKEYDRALREAVNGGTPGSFTPLDMRLVNDAVRATLSDFDPEFGGFGPAPKFPPHATFQFLLGYVASSKADPELRQAAFAASVTTAVGMACGGIHDHVGGGFHRYSTDGTWVLPHFEKTLYDNALLLSNFATIAAYLQQIRPELLPLVASALEGILAFVLRDLRNDDGFYGSARDADSEGEEGRFYTWTVDELEAALGDRAAAFIEAYQVQRAGNFHDEATGHFTGRNVLHFGATPALEFADELNVLLEVREGRPKPAKDGKAVVGWNGLLLSGFATCGAVQLGIDLAERLEGLLGADASLPRTVVDGREFGAGFLEDYAAVALGFFDLAEVFDAASGPAGSSERWRQAGLRVVESMRGRFEDSERGGFFQTEARHEELFGRTKPVVDAPIPSANGMAIQALVRAGYEDDARRALAGFVGWMERAPGSTEALLLATLEVAGPAPAEEPVSTKPGEVRVEITGRELVAGGDGWAGGAIVLEIPAGTHLNSNEPAARWLSPTRVEFAGVDAEVSYPAASENDTYVGRVEIPFRLRLPSGQRAAEFEATVRFQACTSTECLEPASRRFDGVVLSA